MPSPVRRQPSYDGIGTCLQHGLDVLPLVSVCGDLLLGESQEPSKYFLELCLWRAGSKREESKRRGHLR